MWCDRKPELGPKVNTSNRNEDLAHYPRASPRILGTARGEPVALDGGITNRNYRVDVRRHDLRHPRAGQGH